MYAVTKTAPTAPRTKRRGRHPQKALSAAFVRSAPPGRHADGNGLYLFVQPSGTRSWIQRLVVRGRRRELGLGAVALVPLAEAREQALANRRLARSGGDPLTEKRRMQQMPTFADAARQVLEKKQGGWRGRWHAQNWIRSLERYVFPRIGRRPVSEVNTADVLEVLTPIWHSKAATAREVRQRVRSVLEWAIALDLRNDNPCDRVVPVLGPQNGNRSAKPVWTWEPANRALALSTASTGRCARAGSAPGPDRLAVRRCACPTAATPGYRDHRTVTQNDIVTHRRALPHQDVAVAIETVRTSASAQPAVKLAFEFLVLTAARSGEVRLATWDEVDTAGAVWTVSAVRMKAKREHRVPLCMRALEILDVAGRSTTATGWCSRCRAARRSRCRRCRRCSSTTGSRPCRSATVEVEPRKTSTRTS